MARAGASYKEILAVFYPGTELRRFDLIGPVDDDSLQGAIARSGQ
jgi:peptidoglycan hydrolase-like amidase